MDIDLSPEELKDLLTDIGLEAESFEDYESFKGGLKGVVTGEVITCEKHPDADKLKITTVNVGGDALLQIVCGAPNVAVGQKVVVATVGTTLYPVSGEAFDIKKAKIRGVESFGMICAEDEIGVGNSHDGIIVLPADTPVGKPAAELYGIVQDVVFEIGLTPNRTDAFSHFGVSRDIAAAISFRKNKASVLHPLKEETLSLKADFPVKVEVLNQEACPRYCGLVIEGLKVEDSPAWLQEQLKAIGQKPINNVVDVTNYMLHTYGQPLHAFDLHSIQGNVIKVGMQPSGTPFKTLDGNTLELHEEDLMINHASAGMCIAGVYGGFDSGVNTQTNAIFLESAYFNPAHIRRTSLRHGLRTDAAQHFEKGVDPDMTIFVLKKAAALILQLAGGTITSGITDIQSTVFQPFEVQLHPDRVRKITGAPITNDEMERILSLLEIDVVKSDSSWQLKVPPYRTDVTREVDVIEDILRIYGYNNVPIPTRTTAAMNVRKGKDADQMYRLSANLLCSDGFYEVLNNSLTRSRQVEGLIPSDEWVRLLSSINAELDILRPCMQVSMLEVLQHNINRSQKNLKLFEFGKTYHRTENGHNEIQHLFLAVTGDRNAGNWITPAEKADFYYLKSEVMKVLSRLGLQNVSLTEVSFNMYDYALVLVQGKRELATIGKLSSQLASQWGIKQDVFVADILWSDVVKIAGKTSMSAPIVSRFPSVRRDLALLLDKNIKFTDVQAIALKFGKKHLRQVDLFDVYGGDKIEAGKKSYAVSYIFRDDEKTLQDKEVDSVMEILMNQYKQQLNATIRGNV